MLKEHAIAVIGDGSITKTAEAVGVLPSAVSQWPEVLPPRIGDRVIAALVRAGREVPQELLRQPAVPASAAPAAQEAAA